MLFSSSFLSFYVSRSLKYVFNTLRNREWMKLNVTSFLMEQIHIKRPNNRRLSKSTKDLKEMPSDLIPGEGKTPTYTS